MFPEEDGVLRGAQKVGAQPIGIVTAGREVCLVGHLQGLERVGYAAVGYGIYLQEADGFLFHVTPELVRGVEALAYGHGNVQLAREPGVARNILRDGRPFWYGARGGRRDPPARARAASRRTRAAAGLGFSGAHRAPELRSGRPAPPAGSPRRARRNVVHGTVQRLQPEAVGLGLVPVGSGQRPIEVRGDPDLLHARTVLVSGEEALEECRGRPSLVEAQGYEWDSSLRLHRVIIHHPMQPFARVNTRCPSSCAIKHESTA